MHALIIEDEPLIALLIEDQLRAIGYLSIDFAVTEADAVAAAQRRCPDLITSDVRLAAGCGIAAVEAICSERPVPVVFVTASAQDVRRRMEGAVVVAKPFAAADLSRALHAARLA
ncbi:MAG TPA: response regulator [Allosphingosinicella sp.]|jgi:CheY-like chemotaxis protein|nr:response regulator [Allosphingosinicella sp.]